jgi:D-inositol-3-phosphate glycosyltransferase
VFKRNEQYREDRNKSPHSVNARKLKGVIVSMSTFEVEKSASGLGNYSPSLLVDINVAVLTGGFDRPYAFGLSMALISKGMGLDVIGSTEVESPEMHDTPRLNFLNLQGNPRERAGAVKKVTKVLAFYARLLWYAATAKPRIFHILWNNKLQLFDRTILMLYYKLLGKKIVFTAHNVNAGRRDANDSVLNRLTLKIQYHLADHIFVHTEKMKSELRDDFGVRSEAVTVIPFGINNSVPNTEITPSDARQRMGIEHNARTILFFGAIRPYKGLEHLVAAFQQIAPKNESYRLIIAGEVKKGSQQYLRDIQNTIEGDPCRNQIIQKIEFVPDAETEIYFKAADVLVLPYSEIFQSGVLFLAYSFGLPVIAGDVGSFRDDIVPGKTGYLSHSCRPVDLANAIETYFQSDLYKTLEQRRPEIRDYAMARNSWSVVADMTRGLYLELLGMRPS